MRGRGQWWQHQREICYLGTCDGPFLCWAPLPVGLGAKQLEWLGRGVLCPLGTQVLQAVCQCGAAWTSQLGPCWVWSFRTWSWSQGPLTGSAFWLAQQRCYRFPTKVCTRAPNQGWLHGVQPVQSPSAQLSDLVTCSVTPILKCLINFIFEFVWWDSKGCMWAEELHGQWGTGLWAQQAAGWRDCQAGSQLRLVTVMVAAAEAWLAAMATAPEEWEAAAAGLWWEGACPSIPRAHLCSIYTNNNSAVWVLGRKARECSGSTPCQSITVQ